MTLQRGPRSLSSPIPHCLPGVPIVMQRTRSLHPWSWACAVLFLLGVGCSSPSILPDVLGTDGAVDESTLDGGNSPMDVQVFDNGGNPMDVQGMDAPPACGASGQLCCIGSLCNMGLVCTAGN